MSWMPSKFKCALSNGVVNAHGYEYRGLGLFMEMPPSPKGRRPPLWQLIHLNTGHSIASIKGVVAKAFPVATEIADCTDWDFSGLYGWKNRDPDLLSKVHAIAGKYKFVTIGKSQGLNHSEARAKEIAL